MALTYAYPDAYLAQYVTEDREDRAAADVTVMAGGRTFSAAWLERLIVAQAYVITARENQAAPDDLFAAKLKAYRSEFNVLLPQAIAAADAEAGTVGGAALFSVPLERA